MVQVIGPEIDRGGKNATQKKNRQLILPELQPPETVKLHRVQPRPPPPQKKKSDPHLAPKLSHELIN